MIDLLCASFFARPSWSWNHVILDTLLFIGAENINSWYARKGELQCAFL
jgi:hypothetical protein